jgi:Bacterial low temperature requirement A protein (LtrA)
MPIYNLLYRELHKNRPKARRSAVNVEALVEKYGVITLIVLGESLLALLLQGAELISLPDANIGKMYIATAASVLIVYSMQTIYFNVDQNLGKGSVHAIRHNGRLGLIWSQLHIPYHMALAGFLPTGLAKLIKEITLGDYGGRSSAGRTLFSVGWGSALVISSIFGILHKAGPRERTRNIRIGVRVVIVLAVAIGVPFADISAGVELLLYALISAGLAIAEFVLLEADRIGMLAGSPIPSAATSSIDYSLKASEEENDDDNDESSEMSPEDDVEEFKPAESLENGPDVVADPATQRRARREARRRQRRFGCKFEVVCHKNKVRKNVCDEQS